VANWVTVYFRDSDHTSETHDDVRKHLSDWLYNKNHDYKDVLINDPKKGLATDFQILVTPPFVPKNKINRKRPLKWYDRNFLESAQKLLVDYPGAIAIYIPNKLIVLDYATKEESAKLKDFYDASKARSMPHHPLRDQEKIRKELQLKNVNMQLKNGKRDGQINDEL